MIETNIHNVKNISIAKAIDWDGSALGADDYQTQEVVILCADGSKYRINTYSADKQIEIIQGADDE